MSKKQDEMLLRSALLCAAAWHHNQVRFEIVFKKTRLSCSARLYNEAGQLCGEASGIGLDLGVYLLRNTLSWLAYGTAFGDINDFLERAKGASKKKGKQIIHEVEEQRRIAGLSFSVSQTQGYVFEAAGKRYIVHRLFQGTQSDVYEINCLTPVAVASVNFAESDPRD